MASYVFVNEPAVVKDVFVTQQHAFSKSLGARVLRLLLGDGLLTSEEPEPSPDAPNRAAGIPSRTHCRIHADMKAAPTNSSSGFPAKPSMRMQR